MLIKNVSLSMFSLAMIFISMFSVVGKTSANNTHEFLPPIVDLILNSNSCNSPSLLETDNVSANGHEGTNQPANVLDGLIVTRWSSDAANAAVTPFGVGIITFELIETSTVTDIGVAWFRSDERTTTYSIESSMDNVNWLEVVAPTQSTPNTPENVFQNNDIADIQANYIRIIGTGNSGGSAFTSVTEVRINGCNSQTLSGNSSSSSSSGGVIVEPNFGLNPSLKPWVNFDLRPWALDSPALRNISSPVLGTRITDVDLLTLRNGPNGLNGTTQEQNAFNAAYDNFFGTGGNDNYEPSSPYFFTGADGGMVFKSPVDGGRTSSGTKFPRSELREHIRQGVTDRGNGESISTRGLNENNWALGYQPAALVLDNGDDPANITNIGGRNGTLTATLRVNKVTETGRADDVGVTIIGQIHAEEDEPLRLYYRKLPENELGSVYFIHEIRNGGDLDAVRLVGSEADNEFNPINGIALNELFSYEIINQGSTIEVVLRRGDSEGVDIAREVIDMASLGSGYDQADEWMYFKAGAYTQNNVAVENGEPGAATTGFGADLNGDGVGDEADYDQVTFYRLSVRHDVNDCSQCTNLQ